MIRFLIIFLGVFLFSCQQYSTDINIQLIEAVKSGNIDRVRLLIAKGADINAKDERGGTPLHWAAYYNRKEIAKLLLMQGANPEIKDKNGFTPEDVARINGKKEILNLLKEFKH
ncbi:MAG: ankyrin repeat domain-containing protein [Aquificota bacterium]|nr:MAG: ankyrin repeat domain-containing protein [Aquificota bacterium]